MRFKISHPEYNVPRVTINHRDTLDLLDKQTNDPAHWYSVYFYYNKENQIIHTWTRIAEDRKTTFAFVSINNGLDIGNWKDINKDLDRSENDNQKKIFEERILEEIIKELNNK